MKKQCDEWAAPLAREATQGLQRLYDRGVNEPSVTLTSRDLLAKMFTFAKNDEAVMETLAGFLFETLKQSVATHFKLTSHQVSVYREGSGKVRRSDRIQLTVTLYP